MSVNEYWVHRMKAAQRDLIKICGGIERAAEIASLSKSAMGRFNSAIDPDIMPIPAVIALEADCGQPVVTTVLAALQGRRLTDPEQDRAASRGVISAFAAKQQASADTGTEVALGMADGVFTIAEIRAADRKAAAEMEALQNLRASFAHAIAAGGAKADLKLAGE